MSAVTCVEFTILTKQTQQFCDRMKHSSSSIRVDDMELSHNIHILLYHYMVSYNIKPLLCIDSKNIYGIF
jgi:hypothetical protein